MPDLEDIVQRVAISGQDDVISAFGSIGRAGEEAIKRIGEAFGTGGELLAGFTVGLAGVGAALFEWSKHSTEAVHSMELLAKQTSSTVEDVSAMQGAFAELGGSADSLSNAFRRMSFIVAREWEQIKKSVAGARDVIVNDQLSIQKSFLELTKAQQAEREAHGADKNPLLEQQVKVTEATLARQEAEQKLRESQKKSNEDQLNSLDNVSRAIQSVTGGFRTLAEAGKQANLSTENVIKGLISTATPETVTALQNFSGSINDLATLSPKVREIFYNLADFMHNAKDATIEQAVALRLFGRGVGQDLINPLREGRAALKEHEDRLKQFGLVITEDMAKPAEAFHRAYASLSFDLSTTVKQIGLLFDPAFTAGMKQFTGFFEQNHEVILQWARTIEEKARPVIAGFFDALSGFFAAVTGAKVNPGTEVAAWKKSFEDFGTAVSSVAKTVVAAFKLIGDAFAGLRDAINSIFGSKLNLVEVIFGSLVAWKLAGSTIGKVVGGGILGGMTEVIAGALGGPLGVALGILGLGIAAQFPWLRDKSREKAGLPTEGGSGTLEAQQKAADAELARRKRGLHQSLTTPTGIPETEESYSTPEDIKKDAEAIKKVMATIKVIRGAFSTQEFDTSQTRPNFINVVRPGVEAGPSQTTPYDVTPKTAPGTITVARPGAGGPDFQSVQVAAKESSERVVTSNDTNTEATKDNTAAIKTLAEKSKFFFEKPSGPNYITPEGGELDLTKFPGSSPRPAQSSSSPFYLGFTTEQTSQAIDQAKTNLGNGLTDAANIAKSGADRMRDGLQQLGQAILTGATTLQSAIDKAAEAIGLPTGQALGAGRAGGGLIDGPGTGTSDSILTPTSVGEYVVKSDGSNLMDAVRHFVGGNIGNLFSMDHRYDAGRTAAIGPDAHFGTVDLRTNVGDFAMRATRDTIRELSEKATHQAIVRGQRPQTWNRGG